jgi:hypothetical protein
LENVALFHEHLEYFTEIWEMLWPFGTFCGDLVHFSRFWYHAPRKIWQAWFWRNLLKVSTSFVSEPDLEAAANQPLFVGGEQPRLDFQNFQRPIL